MYIIVLMLLLAPLGPSQGKKTLLLGRSRVVVLERPSGRQGTSQIASTMYTATSDLNQSTYNSSG